MRPRGRPSLSENKQKRLRLLPNLRRPDAKKKRKKSDLRN